MTPPRCRTPRRSSLLQDYIGQFSDEALLSAAEERGLAEAIARGDRSARARMIRANLKLVVRIACDYQGRGLPLDDLVGEGNLGLIRAVEGYDPAFGTRFSTYAAYWIKQSIRRALTNTAATIRLPSHMINLLGRWRKAEQALRRDLGRGPSPDEVADAMGLSGSHRDLVARALRARRIMHEGEAAGGGTAPPRDDAADPRESPESALESSEERLGLLRRLDRLDDRERTVVTLRFGLGGGSPLTLKEVGRRLGITREWARKIELRAVRKLGDGPAAEKKPAGRRAASPAPTPARAFSPTPGR